MIYRVVDPTTGEIIRSVDAPLHVASLYLTDGLILVEAGTELMLDDSRLRVSNGEIVRKAGVEDIGGWAGEGATATPVDPFNPKEPHE